jgi:DNA-binding beta-propeller fold protein YncE
MNARLPILAALALLGLPIPALAADVGAADVEPNLDGKPAEASCGPASSTAFTGAAIDAPFFVFDGGSRGPGLGQFDRPIAISYLGAGLLGIVDTGNDRIKIVSTRGYFQDFLGGPGSEPPRMKSPSSLVVDRRGGVWAVDTGNHRIQRLSFFREQVSDPKGTFLGAIIDPGPADAEGQSSPWTPSQATTDPEGRLYVTDPDRSRILRFDADGQPLDPWGAETGLDLVEPWGLTLDAEGQLYVSDRAAHRVVKLSTEGKELARWGGKGDAEGQLDRPLGLVTGANGHVFVADSGNHRVQKFDADGRFVASVGCRGTGVGQMIEPSDVTLDRKHHLYVVDTGNHRIQKLGHQ